MKKLYLMVFAVMMMAVVSASVQAAGFGISPSIFQLKDLARGNSYEQYIRIISLEETDNVAVLSADGDAASWLTFLDKDSRLPLPNNSITIPAKSSKEILGMFNIPADAPNGGYQGYIMATPATPHASAGTSTVSIVVRAIYILNVTGTEQIAGTVSDAVAKDTESGQPLRITYDFRNTGNVAAEPTANVKILKDGKTIDTFSALGQQVKVGSFISQDVEWNTENQGTGNFTAQLEVLLENKRIYEKTLPFNIFPRGTFTAEAAIGQITKPSSLSVSEVGKADINVYNTGQIDVTAKATAEVKKGGQVVDVLNSDEKLIKPSESSVLTLYFKPTQAGQYVIQGTVFYAGKELPMDEMTVDVKSAGESTVNTAGFSSGPNYLLYLSIGLAVVLVIVVVGFIIFVSKKNK